MCCEFVPRRTDRNDGLTAAAKQKAATSKQSLAQHRPSKEIETQRNDSISRVESGFSKCSALLVSAHMLYSSSFIFPLGALSLCCRQCVTEQAEAASAAAERRESRWCLLLLLLCLLLTLVCLQRASKREREWRRAESSLRRRCAHRCNEGRPDQLIERKFSEQADALTLNTADAGLLHRLLVCLVA